MKIILKEDVPNLGFKNEVVEVKPGYGRNFLIPKGIAVIANESSLKVLAENLRQQEHKLAVIKEKAQALANKLEGAKVEISVKTSVNGTIYGSVSASMIADNLESQGFEINRKMLQVPGSIKEVGEYVAKIRLHKDITVEVPVIVVSENAPVSAPQVETKTEEVVEEVSAEETPAEESEA